MSLLEGDEVVITETLSGNEWMRGRNERTGKVGVFPANYVQSSAQTGGETAKDD